MNFSNVIDLNFLSGLQRLEAISILETPLTQHGLNMLPGLNRLTKLSLSGS